MSTPEERAQWIEDCQGLVHSLAWQMAWQMARRLPVRVEVDDLAGYGQLGLTQAASAFDPARGVKFSTFAFYRIRGAIHDGLAQMLWYRKGPMRALECDRLVNETLADDVESETGSGSTVEDSRWFRDLAGRLATVFLVGGTTGAEGAQSEPEDVASPNPISVVSRREIGKRLREAIESLPEDSRTLIRTAYFEHASLQEAADRLGISRSWASRLHAKSLRQLEALLRKSGVDSA